jgi:hypothetical protein
MKTTTTAAFSIPIKLWQKFPKLVQKYYEDGRINKPTSSEAISFLILEALKSLPAYESQSLSAGYAEMARDIEHEEEALEWSEGLIGDITGE